MRRHQQHAKHRGDGAQGDLVEIGVAPDTLHARRHQRQVVERGAVIIHGGIFVAALFQQGSEPVGVDRLIGVHGPRGKLRKTKRRRNRRDRQKQPQSAATLVQSWLRSRHVTSAKYANSNPAAASSGAQ